MLKKFCVKDKITKQNHRFTLTSLLLTIGVFTALTPEAHSEPWQTFKMKNFARVLNTPLS